MGMKGGLFNPFFTGNYANEYGYFSSGVTAKYQAVLDRATVQGYTKPSAAKNNAWNTFLNARIADGSFAKMDFLYNLAWNDATLSAFSALDHKTATREGVYTSSPTYGVKGIKGDNLAAFFDTSFRPSLHATNFTQNDAALGIWITTIPSAGTGVMGDASTTTDRMTYAVNNNTNSINSTNSASINLNTSGTGYKAFNRTDSTNCQLYNGLTRTDFTGTSTGVSASNLVLLKRNSTLSDVEIGLFFGAGSLTETQHNNIRNGYATFLTAIGL